MGGTEATAKQPEWRGRPLGRGATCLRVSDRHRMAETKIPGPTALEHGPAGDAVNDCKLKLCYNFTDEKGTKNNAAGHART